MSDLNCIICFEALSSAPLGAATPCGHCFHQNCFGQWAAASIRGGSRAVTCPMCNGKTTSFTNLFLDLQQVAVDDDISLSSASSDEEETVTNDKLKDDNEPEESCDSNDQLFDNAQERVERQNERESDDTDHPDVVEIADDDSSVVEILSDAFPPQKRKRSPRQRESDDRDETNSRIKRKAKRLKKQNKFLESQREEFVERERKLLDDFSKTRERLEDLQQEHEAQQDGAKAAQLELVGLKVQVARLTRERDRAKQDLHEMVARKSKAENDLDELKNRYREDVRNATSQALQEVKLITERQPILVQENHELKELVVKKNHEIQNLRQQLNSLNACVRQQGEKEVLQYHKSGKKQAKNIAKAYQEAKEEQMRAEEEIRNSRKQARATSSRPSKNYSAQGTRIFNAASKDVASKKICVADVLGSAPRRKDGQSSNAAQRHRSEARRDDSLDSEEDALFNGTSLSVSSLKRRKIEPRPVGKTGATKVKKVVRKEMNMRDYFR